MYQGHGRCTHPQPREPASWGRGSTHGRWGQVPSGISAAVSEGPAGRPESGTAGPGEAWGMGLLSPFTAPRGRSMERSLQDPCLSTRTRACLPSMPS